jgi:hypothetical protein
MITSLEEISIHGIWGAELEVKQGLVLGLQDRHLLSPLKKLSLDLKSQKTYEIEDFEMLCDAIFSLPQLENLSLVVGEEFTCTIEQYHKDVMYKSWCDKGAGVMLKSIHFQSDIEPDHLSKRLKVASMTQNISSRAHTDKRNELYGNYEYYFSSADDHVFHFLST